MTFIKMNKSADIQNIYKVNLMSLINKRIKYQYGVLNSKSIEGLR